MIRIHQGYVEDSDGMSTLSTDIDINDKKKRVCVSVESEYGKFLSPERADYALVGLLAHAMRRGHDIICEAPVTEELLYNIREFLIPALVRTDSRAYHVKIQADIAPPLDKLPVSKVMHGGVGTGVSCGVDSLYTITKYLDCSYPNQNLTHLCIYDNGSISCYGKENIPFIKEKIFERAENVAKELNLPLLKLETNFQTEIPQSHFLTHTYMDALAIYALQKLWRVYYYSSSRSFWEFSLEKNISNAPGSFEPFLLDCFSTSKLRIISSGSEVDRNDKVDFIADNPVAQKHIHVCLKKATNCGKCPKCLRTLVALDALGKLDNFRESFDIDEYIKRRRRWYRYVNSTIKKNPQSPYFAKSYEILYERHKKFFNKLNAKKK